MAQLRTKPPQHGDDHVIIANEEPIRLDLRRQVPIAEMPTKAQQQRRCCRAYFDQRLGRSVDQDDTAAFQKQTIALAQRNCLLKIKQESKAVFSNIALPAPEAVVEIQCHGVARGTLHPTAGGQHLGHAGKFTSHQNRK